MSTTPKRIHLRGSGIAEEAVAAAAIRPGDLLAYDSAGKVAKHATAGGWAEKAFALEDALQGKDIDENYALGDRVSYVIGQSGDIVRAWLSGGENAAKGDFLTSNGDGALKVATSSDIRIAVALEAVDASDSNDVDERITVRLL